VALNLAYTLHHLQMKFQFAIGIELGKWQTLKGKWRLTGSIYITSFANEMSIAN